MPPMCQKDLSTAKAKEVKEQPLGWNAAGLEAPFSSRPKLSRNGLRPSLAFRRPGGRCFHPPQGRNETATARSELPPF